MSSKGKPQGWDRKLRLGLWTREENESVKGGLRKSREEKKSMEAIVKIKLCHGTEFNKRD